jgi:WD40 repeat protein
MKTIKRLFFCLITVLSTAQPLPARAAQNPELVVQTGHASRGNRMWFSPDGKLIASGSFQVVRLWDAESGEARRVISIGAIPSTSTRSRSAPTGKRLLRH